MVLQLAELPSEMINLSELMVHHLDVFGDVRSLVDGILCDERRILNDPLRRKTESRCGENSDAKRERTGIH